MQTFDANKEFESAEIAIFTKLLESYTDSIGYGTTNHILTNCTVVSQLFNDTILTINYSMNYTTRYQYTYDISNYPVLFYESQNMTILTEELARREFDPELKASSLLMLGQDITITAAPVVQPTIGPSVPSPTIVPMQMMTATPTQENGILDQVASGDGIGESSQPNNGDDGPDLDASPSGSSTNDVPTGDSDTMQQTDDSSNTVAPLPSPGIGSLSANPEQKSAKSGLAVGVGIFVAAILCVGLFFAWRRFNPKENEIVASVKADVSVEEDRPGHQKNPSFLIVAEGIESPKSFSDEEYLNPLQKALSLDADLEAANSSANSFATGATLEQQDNIVPLLLTDLDGSEDTSDEEYFDELSMSGGADIFDSYKNNQLEDLRDGVVAIIADAESLVSLAMTASLLDDSQLTVDSILDGAENPEQIEANFLYETSDWLKKNKANQSLEAKEIFQQILNKVFVVVRNGVFMPHDAIRVVSYCAGILGLKLLTKDFPNDLLLVQGMRKTNDASQGRTHLVNAFKQFGIIAGAAIAVDKGFGFVRFDSPSSADSALDRFRTTEIEVQNVSVMIERPQIIPSK